MCERLPPNVWLRFRRSFLNGFHISVQWVRSVWRTLVTEIRNSCLRCSNDKMDKYDNKLYCGFISHRICTGMFYIGYLGRAVWNNSIMTMRGACKRCWRNYFGQHLQTLPKYETADLCKNIIENRNKSTFLHIKKFRISVFKTLYSRSDIRSKQNYTHDEARRGRAIMTEMTSQHGSHYADNRYSFSVTSARLSDMFIVYETHDRFVKKP
jgi:hypothetical protein